MRKKEHSTIARLVAESFLKDILRCIHVMKGATKDTETPIQRPIDKKNENGDLEFYLAMANNDLILLSSTLWINLCHSDF